MVHFEIVNGKKAPGDKLIKVWSSGEIWTLRELLQLLSMYFESEDACYPINRGFQGRSMLLKAIIDVYSGIPIQRVLKSYRLNKKTRKNGRN
jgi:hypothetical protein